MTQDQIFERLDGNISAVNLFNAVRTMLTLWHDMHGCDRHFKRYLQACADLRAAMLAIDPDSVPPLWMLESLRQAEAGEHRPMGEVLDELRRKREH